MSNGPQRPIDFATLLYRQLPSVYRERDNHALKPDGSTQPGDLALLASDWGDLLDALYRTLQQRYYDIFPETEGPTDPEGLARGCQDWVMPYIAQLLDVQLLSPLEQGQRQELGRAVEWRQRKGTPLVIEDIAEAMAALEVELKEGWTKVARTPRPGFKLLPPEVFGEPDPQRFGSTGQTPQEHDPRYPQRRAEHPGLPSGTVDFRRPSRAVRAAEDTPSSKYTLFGDQGVNWRQAWPHGTPCFPDSFQDVSARLVDLRSPDSRRGHAHPRRVVLYAAPFPGFFSAKPVSVRWQDIKYAVLNNTPLPEGIAHLSVRSFVKPGSSTRVRELVGLHAAPVKIRGIVELKAGDLPDTWSFDNLWFDNRLDIAGSQADFKGCAVRELQIHDGPSQTGPALDARNTLFMRILAPTDLIRLTCVTVLERLVANHLQASDCLLMPALRKDLPASDTDVPASGCIRYSRVPYLPAMPPDPQWMSQGSPSALKVFADSCHTQAPVFWHTQFGTPGCGVLHSDTPACLRFGAEDGAELGAYHDLAYTLREQAVMAKIQDNLPVGIQAVMVPDPSLGITPPVLRQPN